MMREKHLEREGGSFELDSGWEEVVRKKNIQSKEARGKVDVAASVWKVPYKEKFSFYFSDFPETHGAKEMLKAFRLYGEAMEVVIPPKRDKWGKRFSFVRFCNVGDPRIFAIKLDNIIFGATKIHVNVPRFQWQWNNGHKTQQDQRQWEEKQRTDPKEIQQRHQLKQSDEPRKNQPQRVLQVWKKKEGDNGGGRNKERQETANQWKEKMYQHNKGKQTQHIIYHRKNNIAEFCYNVSEDEMEKFKKMYVGTVKTPGTTYTAQEWFNVRGFFLVKITPLGANKVLMEEMEDGAISTLLNEYKDWLFEKFDDIRIWNSDVVDNERVVWVRCHGVPIHAWNDDFFASLARNFGEYLGVDEAIRTKSAMDVTRIRLRSNGYDVFNAVVTANINGSLFHIKMTEEWCGPLQWIDNCCKKCWKKNDDSGESSDSDDSDAGVPPLFMVEEEWCSNDEEDGVDGVEGSENEEERVKEYDEDSNVQETPNIHEENRCNDCEPVGKGTLDFNAGGEKQNACSSGVLKDGVGEREQIRKKSVNCFK